MSRDSSDYGVFNSWDAVKLLALVLMLVDHAGAFLVPHTAATEALRAIGRGAAPLFLFLTGFAPRQHIQKELIASAIVLGMFNSLLNHTPLPLNILFTIIISRLVLMFMEKKHFKVWAWEWWVAMTFLALPSGLLFEYGTYGIVFALSGYMLRHPERRPFIRTAGRFTIMTFFGHWVIQAAWFGFGMTGGIISAIILAITCGVVLKMPLIPAPIPISPALARPLAWTARNMLYIYIGHVMLFALLGAKFGISR